LTVIVLIAYLGAAVSLPTNFALKDNRELLLGVVVASILGDFSPKGRDESGHVENLLNLLGMDSILISNLGVNQSFYE
jgi:hypothetical protein